MPGGFFDWVRNKAWRFAGEHKAFTLPPNPSDRQIRKAIDLLFDKNGVCEARIALLDVGSRAAPLLEQAVQESRSFDTTEWLANAETPLEAMLFLLDRCGSTTPLRFAERLVNDSAWQRRRVAAHYLPRTGLAKYTKEVLKLLSYDPDEVNASLVHDRALAALREAAEAGRIEHELADAVFGFTRSGAFRRDRGWGSKSAELMLLLDRDRAIAELTAREAIDLGLNWLHKNLGALRDAGVPFSNEILRRLMNESLQRYADEPEILERDHWSNIADACLSYLSHQNDDGVAEDIDRLIEHPDDLLRDTAERLQDRRLNFDPFRSAYDAKQQKGMSGITPAQRTYLAVYLLDAEVQNGGFLQYFANSSGENVAAAHAGLIEIEAHASAQIVGEAIAMFGPGGVPTDRDERGDLLARMIPEDHSPFDSLDDRWYADEDRLSIRLRKYAIANRAQIEA